MDGGVGDIPGVRRSVIRGRAGSRPRFGGHPSRLFGRVAASEPQRCAAGRGLVAPPLVRKSRRLLAAAVCWPPAPPWSRSRAWSSVGRCGPPRAPAGAPAPRVRACPPPSVGRALRWLSGRWPGGAPRGRGGLPAPPPPPGGPCSWFWRGWSRRPGWGVPPPAGGGMWYAAKRHTTRYQCARTAPGPWPEWTSGPGRSLAACSRPAAGRRGGRWRSSGRRPVGTTDHARR